MSLRFDFGRNWQDFSAAKLNTQRVSDAERSLETLLGDKIRGHTFLDVGCGSGLFSIAAARCGATRIAAFDFNATAIDVAEGNWARFATRPIESARPRFCVGDVLDPDFLASLGQFDVVYAWGVLHHTGAMWKAIQNAASLVKPDGGTLVIAIYNRHWTSPVWKQVKRLYNLSPAILRPVFHYVFGAAIYAGVWATTGQNPMHKERGHGFLVRRH